MTSSETARRCFLLTGLGGSRGYWANLLPTLAREFTLVLHDHTCTGQSEGSRSDVTVRFPIDWLANWRGVNDAIAKLLGALKPGG